MYWNDAREKTRQERMTIGFDDLKEGWGQAPATYTDDHLTISGHPVMERWEESYMKELASIAAANGGKVLEVGFGMGISATFLQRHDIEKHMIIEANREVCARARIFSASAFRPVDVLFGFWEEVVPGLKTESFSGILFDTYPLVPEQVHKNHFAFFKEAHRLLKPGGVLTYYSDEMSEFSPDHFANLKAAGFSRITSRVCTVEPPADCKYWTSRTILAPIIIK